MLKPEGRRPPWLRTDRLLGEHGIVSEGARGRREFSRRMEAARKEANNPQRLAQIRRAWKLGSEDFLDWIVEKVELRVGEGHSRRQRDETEERKAERIVAEAMKRLGWTKVELVRRKKGDAAKVALARRLRDETTVSLKWIAEKLHMGTWTHVSNRLYHDLR
jgi:replicative superfamily II helicase